MKKLFLSMFLLGIFYIGVAQTNAIDVIYCKNGSVLKGIIIEQIPNESVKIQTADGSVFVYKISDIEKMTKEMTQTNTNVYNGNADELCNLAKDDAQVYYDGKGSLKGAIWATNLITSPLFGLIPTAIAVSSDVKSENLNYPSREKWNDPNYAQCYKEEANKKKNRKAWGAYAVSSGVWVGLMLLLL